MIRGPPNFSLSGRRFATAFGFLEGKIGSPTARLRRRVASWTRPAGHVGKAALTINRETSEMTSTTDTELPWTIDEEITLAQAEIARERRYLASIEEDYDGDEDQFEAAEIHLRDLYARRERRGAA